MPDQRLLCYEHAFNVAMHQVRALVLRYPNQFPMYTVRGRWGHTGEAWTDWCGGFLAGMMWLFFQRTRDVFWRDTALEYSRRLEPRKHDRSVHDLGFIFLNTYRHWYDQTGDPRCMDVVAEAASTLAGRFQEKGQYLSSFLGPESLFVDIMMNVPLLFVGADWLERNGVARSLSSDRAVESPPSAAELRRKARAHCLTSQRFLVRPDGSTAHEAIFDTNTGDFVRESTQQGLRPDSCWSRGLAWALYGFGTVYGLTGEQVFLETACRCADHFLTHLPPGRIPYWDFRLPEGPDRLWDSSAAAIAASGLFQLADLCTSRSATSAQRYQQAAFEILDALCSEQFLVSTNSRWEGILLHAVYHYHKRLGVDESVMWGDHFFVEALVKAMAHDAMLDRTDAQ